MVPSCCKFLLPAWSFPRSFGWNCWWQQHTTSRGSVHRGSNLASVSCDCCNELLSALVGILQRKSRSRWQYGAGRWYWLVIEIFHRPNPNDCSAQKWSRHSFDPFDGQTPVLSGESVEGIPINRASGWFNTSSTAPGSDTRVRLPENKHRHDETVPRSSSSASQRRCGCERKQLSSLASCMLPFTPIGIGQDANASGNVWILEHGGEAGPPFRKQQFSKPLQGCFASYPVQEFYLHSSCRNAKWILWVEGRKGSDVQVHTWEQQTNSTAQQSEQVWQRKPNSSICGPLLSRTLLPWGLSGWQGKIRTGPDLQVLHSSILIRVPCAINLSLGSFPEGSAVYEGNLGLNDVKFLSCLWVCGLLGECSFWFSSNDSWLWLMTIHPNNASFC